MSFRQKVRKVMGRQSSSDSEPTESPVSSQDVSGLNTPSLTGSSIASPEDRDNLTIDPRENPLMLIESNATAKKKSRVSRLLSSINKKDETLANWPDNIYKPHEIPLPKYKRPVHPEHAATLNAYNLRSAFANLRRRSSFMSQYSPMGTRLQSRVGSVSSRGGRSAGPSRNHSFIGEVLLENVSDDDALNVGLTRQHTIDEDVGRPNRSRGDTITTTSTVPELVQSSSIDSADSERILRSGQGVPARDLSLPDHGARGFSKPFDEEELSQALTRKLVTS